VTVCSVEPRLEEAIESAEALVFGSNTLVGERERALTMRARELAFERDLPVLFDPNLRAHRWGELDQARKLCLEAAEGCFCVRANEEEGRWLTGAKDAAAAARGLAKAGGKIGVVTRGPDGAIASGPGTAECEVEGIEVEVVSPLGAGDAFMGALTAGFARRDWAPDATADALAEANRAGAETCTVWRAVL
jgi:sugar/nucleoside kinase (ribokinase family)